MNPKSRNCNVSTTEGLLPSNNTGNKILILSQSDSQMLRNETTMLPKETLAERQGF
jgi:hypothetical protein